MAEETEQSVIYRGNSIISIEKVAEYPYPVVIKKSSKRHPSRRSLRSLAGQPLAVSSTCVVKRPMGLKLLPVSVVDYQLYFEDTFESISV